MTVGRAEKSALVKLTSSSAGNSFGFLPRVLFDQRIAKLAGIAHIVADSDHECEPHYQMPRQGA